MCVCVVKEKSALGRGLGCGYVALRWGTKEREREWVCVRVCVSVARRTKREERKKVSSEGSYLAIVTAGAGGGGGPGGGGGGAAIF